MLIYNTLSRRKEEFINRDPGKISMYVCGPTTYNYIHLGNARPLVVFDIVRRYFLYKGYAVRYIQNFTDIDDKIISRAREKGEDPMSLANKYIKEYYQDAEALNVLRADVYPKVSEHINEIVDMVRILFERGNAYEVDGNVFFKLSTFPEYGKLSGRSLSDMQAGARVEVDERKSHPMDFVLWKAAKEGEPAWESPWGPGRPGWHIECSAMARKYLGENFDIHGGGFDLIFPHHENEIAQSEAATGNKFARFWIHNGFITVNEEKMSKSLGNFFLVREILAEFPPETVRFFLIATHYRSPLDFDREKLTAAGRGLERIKTCVRLLEEAATGALPDGTIVGNEQLSAILSKRRQEFDEAMDDDFNTALAIGTLFDSVGDINSYLHKVRLEGKVVSRSILKQAETLLESFNFVLGIFRSEPSGKIILDREEDSDNKLANDLMELIINVRQEARTRKEWATADNIRNGLKDLGIIIEDTPRGARWKKQL